MSAFQQSKNRLMHLEEGGHYGIHLHNRIVSKYVVELAKGTPVVVLLHRPCLRFSASVPDSVAQRLILLNIGIAKTKDKSQSRFPVTASIAGPGFHSQRAQPQ